VPRRALAIAWIMSLVTGLAASPAGAAPPRLAARTVQGGLSIPWDVAFAPGGQMLVSERPGRIRVYAGRKPGARLVSTHTISSVRAEGESGVMGIAALRKAGKVMVFVCASRQFRGTWRNQVLRYELRDGRLSFDRYVVRSGIRASTIHNGCAVEIGPDGKVWIGTGDAAVPSLSQDPGSLNGKVLRVNTDGSIPDDNPRRAQIYTSGHRNVQGIAFRPDTKRAYAVEHGPERDDEINRLLPGRNYGWPCYTGRGSAYSTSGCSAASAYVNPVWTSGSPTLATSGAAFPTGRRWASWRNDLFVSTLKESDVRRFAFVDATTARHRDVLFDGSFGRLRAAVVSPGGGALYVTTSNGSSDRVIRIRPRR
jgi:glucose/arabinose dehydrogenase